MASHVSTNTDNPLICISMDNRLYNNNSTDNRFPNSSTASINSSSTRPRRWVGNTSTRCGTARRRLRCHRPVNAPVSVSLALGKRVEMGEVHAMSLGHGREQVDVDGGHSRE
uniref:Uncharacterized protein n=1 Tax=Hyaloperonospora arabidopsidis (strain Emoy2) TaxID=559515 RepID=M4B712_HYAAE